MPRSVTGTSGSNRIRSRLGLDLGDAAAKKALRAVPNVGLRHADRARDGGVGAATVLLEVLEDPQVDRVDRLLGTCHGGLLGPGACEFRTFRGFGGRESS